MNTERCRGCLARKKNLRSIFDNINDNINFADILSSLAHVKITKDDGLPDKICLACRRKVCEINDFKTLVERSDIVLNEKENQSCKRLKFDNIGDVKLEIEFVKSEPVPKVKCETVKFDLHDQNDIIYNDTTIKKLPPQHRTKKKSISVLEFLNSIKTEEDLDQFNNSYDFADDNYGPENEKEDDDYIPDTQPVKKDKAKEKKKKKLKTKKAPKVTREEGKKVLIKPVYLKNYKLVPTRCKKKGKSEKIKMKKLCPHCGVVTINIKSHILIHGEKQFRCDQCPKSFNHKSQLRSHLLRHNGTRDFKCDQCISTFYTKSALQGHLDMHVSEKKHVCDICNKAFKRVKTLERHVVRHNSANKLVKCEECNMSFFDNVALRAHMRVHTGERPYKCEICAQPYSYKHDFNRHCFKKHGVFLKRRQLRVMNPEVLERELEVTKNLLLRARGVISGDGPLPPEFEGSEGALAYQQAIRDLKSKPWNVDIFML